MRNNKENMGFGLLNTENKVAIRKPDFVKKVGYLNLFKQRWFCVSYGSVQTDKERPFKIK
ncbi:MAG: hypothetical protein SWZ49_16240 [Cyanobacteriota bacterium]|nr:hypothetical protein [Cyanobacteriota bacterium]